MDRVSTQVGLILAGGRSRRFGRDKAWEPWGGVPLVRRLYGLFRGIFSETYVVLHLPSDRFLGMNVILDLYPEGGPMNGIYSALVTTCAPSVFVAACDLPRLEPRDIERLLAHWEPAFPALVYRRAGAWEPLCGIYSRKLIPLLRQRLQNGDYQLQDLLRDAGARGIEYPAKNGEDGLANMNTQEDYRNLLLDEDNNERRENYADAS